MYNTILEAVAAHALESPDKPAVIAGSEAVDYARLWERVMAAAAGLREQDVRRGDRVVLSASASSPSFIYGYLAAHALGAVTVPVDPQTPEMRLNYIIRQVEPRAVFTTKKPLETVHAATRTGDAIAPGLPPDAFPSPVDVADVLFTTGTTGDPKGVVLTHRNILCAAENINSFVQNTAGDREVVPLPLSHSFGLGRLRCNLLAGGTVILTDGLTFPARIFQSVEHWSATGMAIVPAGVEVLLRLTRDRIGRYAHQLRYIEIGSAPMLLERKKKLMELLPYTRICMHYGLTEASRSTFIEFHESAHKLTSIGRQAPNVEVRIVDADNRECPPDVQGRILVKGGMVMRGYWRNPEQSAAVLNAEWLYTGDYGFRDIDGYVYLVARESELINVGGRKVCPIEVERVLEAHADVSMSACIGIPDPKGVTGEAVKAFLVANVSSQLPDDGELAEFLRGKLEPYKIPVEYEWLERLPMTSSGKLQRLKLKNKGQPLQNKASE